MIHTGCAFRNTASNVRLRGSIHDTFFALLFGSSVVGPYVGNLATATIVDNELSLTEVATSGISSHSAKEYEQQQLRRQVSVALHSFHRVDEFTSNKMAQREYQISCKLEAESLAFALRGNIAKEFLLGAIG